MTHKLRLRHALIALTGLALLAALWLWHVNYNDGVDLSAPPAAALSPAEQQTRLERGSYLARIGNCLACHTARGGAPATGGRALTTDYGTVFSSNLTPDPDTGIGRWSAQAFWRALHHGRSLDGRLLVPAFPYTHTTLLTRADSDALFTYFSSLPPATAAAPAHQLRWPYNSQLALAVWRALYFTPGSFTPEPQRDTAWNQGAYLVRGVAHCSACHTPRNALGGADWKDLSGGLMPAQGWWAPSLLDPAEAGVQNAHAQDVMRLLQTGTSALGQASGPMAEVVLHGTRHLSDTDAQAITTYLQALPTQTQPRPSGERRASASSLERGASVYEQHCASCHGTQGEGIPGAYPPLAGNRAVTMGPVHNLLQAVLHGGFAPATPGNPRPFGMPPFVLELSERDIADVLSHIRQAWGNTAGEVSPQTVHALRLRQGSAGAR